MAVDDADVRFVAPREQALLNAHVDFRADFERGIDENIECVVDHAFGGVFDGNASVVGAPGFDFMEDVADAEL